MMNSSEHNGPLYPLPYLSKSLFFPIKNNVGFGIGVNIFHPVKEHKNILCFFKTWMILTEKIFKHFVIFPKKMY